MTSPGRTGEEFWVGCRGCDVGSGSVISGSDVFVGWGRAATVSVIKGGVFVSVGSCLGAGVGLLQLAKTRIKVINRYLIPLDITAS